MSMSGMGSGTSRLPMTEPMRGVHMVGSARHADTAGHVWPVYTDQGGRAAAPSSMRSRWPWAYGFTIRPACGRRRQVYRAGDDEPRACHAPRWLPAFMHRYSASTDPEAPIARHWFDSRPHHLRRGNGGACGEELADRGECVPGREEAGRKPLGIEGAEASEGWSVRAAAVAATSPQWLMQAGFGKLEGAGNRPPRRGRAPLRHLSAFQAFRPWARCQRRDARRSPDAHRLAGRDRSDLNAHNTLFGRIENVNNDELFLVHDDPLHGQPFRVTKFKLGYAVPAFRIVSKVQVALGGSGALFAKPAALGAAYGKNPIGAAVLARITRDGLERTFRNATSLSAPVPALAWWRDGANSQGTCFHVCVSDPGGGLGRTARPGRGATARASVARGTLRIGYGASNDKVAAKTLPG